MYNSATCSNWTKKVDLPSFEPFSGRVNSWAINHELTFKDFFHRLEWRVKLNINSPHERMQKSFAFLVSCRRYGSSDYGVHFLPTRSDLPFYFTR